MTGTPDDKDPAMPEPADPRILAVARAIGRLIARERFKAAGGAGDEPPRNDASGLACGIGTRPRARTRPAHRRNPYGRLPGPPARA